MNPPSDAYDPLEVIYRRLTGSGQVEFPGAELKSYSFSAANIRNNAKKIAETIAGLANRGFEQSYVVGVSSDPAEAPLLDPAELDDLLMKHVHPRVVAELVRRTYDGLTVDFAIIPKSALRPHIIRIDDGRYVVPLRGLANNVTAARNEIEHIYESRMMDILQRAFPQLTIGQQDPLSSYTSGDTTDPGGRRFSFLSQSLHYGGGYLCANLTDSNS